MDITLTNAELGMVLDAKIGVETVEETFHRLMLPLVVKAGDQRLQKLAEAYRSLTPDLQLEAIQVLKDWQASRT